MPSQQDLQSSPTALPANPTTQTSPAKPAAPATTSKQPFFTEEECIILILSPHKTVHPLINKPGPGAPVGIRIFEDTEQALVEATSNKMVSSHPFAIVPLKGIF